MRSMKLIILHQVMESIRIFAIVLLFTTVVAVQSQDIIPANNRYNRYYDESPKPYSFNYNAPLEDGVGQSSRVEAADGSGKVQGSYTVTNDEGHTRIVDYIADQYGFRANIRTNEPGTDNKNPADVVIESAGPYASRAFQYAPGLRRPIATTLVESPVPIGPVLAPENKVVPVGPEFYNIPAAYNRNHLYRHRVRYHSVRY